jgi:hypothetical protein
VRRRWLYAKIRLVALSILADLGAIWNWLPVEVRTEDPDPGKVGIQKMRTALAHLRV